MKNFIQFDTRNKKPKWESGSRHPAMTWTTAIFRSDMAKICHRAAARRLRTDRPRNHGHSLAHACVGPAIPVTRHQEQSPEGTGNLPSRRRYPGSRRLGVKFAWTVTTRLPTSSINSSQGFRRSNSTSCNSIIATHFIVCRCKIKQRPCHIVAEALSKVVFLEEKCRDAVLKFLPRIWDGFLRQF